MPLQHLYHISSHLSLFFQRNPPLFWVFSRTHLVRLRVQHLSQFHGRQPSILIFVRRHEELPIFGRALPEFPGGSGNRWEDRIHFVLEIPTTLCAIRNKKKSSFQEENIWQEYISAQKNDSQSDLLFLFDVWKGEGFEWFESVGCLFKDGKKSWTFEPCPFNPLKGRIFQWLATQ